MQDQLDEPRLLLGVLGDVDLMSRVLEARVGGLELLEEDRDLARFWFESSVSNLFIAR